MTHSASLGMYDLPGLHDANDRFWSAIAAHLAAEGFHAAPPTLDRTRPLEEIWSDPNLLLAQTCGYPLMTAWRDRLRYVTTPHYAVPGCEGARHRSRFVVRQGDGIATLRDGRGQRVAVNDLASNSGMNLLRAAVAPFASDGRFFSEVVVTGSHFASAIAVADGVADVAAIDAVTYTHLERAMPETVRSLATIGWSSPSPSLPFVTAITTPPLVIRLLRRAIPAAIRAVPEAAAALRLAAVETIGLRSYRAVLRLEATAEKAGYPHLA